MKDLLSFKRPGLWLAAILIINAALTITAMRRTSTTFDEIVMMSGGARGYHTGEWDIAPEHPPGVQYLYGLPVYLAQPEYPDESRIPTSLKRSMGYRYAYAKEFFRKAPDVTKRFVFVGRLPAALMALALIALVFFFTRRTATDRTIADRAAVLAAAIVAFLPDVLAHGGIAYNDVPVAAAVFGSVWLIDRALRAPSWQRGIVAGLSIGLALGIKNSAVALGPIAVALLVLEAVRSGRNGQWRRNVLLAAACTIIGAYAALVMIYRGDFLLREYQYAIWFSFGQVTQTAAPSYLFGQTSTTGWWYFFPVAFLFKTSAALHVLMLLGIAGLVAAVRRAPRAVLDSPLRAPLVALLVFGALLLTAKLNIGFRYALPALPFVAVLTAAGVARLWDDARLMVRAVVVAALLWLVAFPVSYYPRFLTFVSEYGPRDRDENYTVFADSSLDWGQGLIELEEFMRAHSIRRVYLSYFGSVSPHAYGIDYEPLPSFFELDPVADDSAAPRPEWIVISATNLTGTYFRTDTFAKFRRNRPHHVIGHNMYLYQLSPDIREAP